MQTGTLTIYPSIFQWLSRLILKMIGWRIGGSFPNLSKYVIVAAPHTSSWDFVIALLWMLASGQQFNWLGKDSLFRPPHGFFFRGVGGIPVRRHVRTNFVQQIVETFEKSERMILAIAPEGTRKKAAYWKTGFYYIALGAKVPISLAYLDFGRKEVGMGPLIHPTGDIHADFALLRNFYADKTGCHPKHQGPVEAPPDSKGPPEASKG